MSILCGIAVNDSGYSVKRVILKNKLIDKRDICPFYLKWQSMIYRCYGEMSGEKYPSYVGCTVCDEWLIFSNFKNWMEQQDWKGKELDKDILFIGNRVYSPDYCVFVSRLANGFTKERLAARGDLMLGVYFDTSAQKFKAQISNPFTLKRESLGRFKSEIEAHLAWKKRKHELSCQLADLQTDERVANALRTRYL